MTDPGAIVPGIDDAPFWAAVAERRLLLQRCAGCGRFRHPPGPRCAACRSEFSEWVEAPSEGELYSWTSAPDGRIVALVLFPGCDGVRLVSNVVGTEAARLRIGMTLRLCWQERGGALLPVFRVAEEGGS